MVGICNKCCTIVGILLFVVGIAELLVDFGVWKFWNISWSSAVLIIVGFACLARNFCKECMSK